MEIIQNLIPLLKGRDYVVKTAFLTNKKLGLNEPVLVLYLFKGEKITVKYVVIPAGTKIMKKISINSKTGKPWNNIISRRDEASSFLVDANSHYLILTNNLLFNNVSAASSFILGYPSDGYEVFKDSSGNGINFGYDSVEFKKPRIGAYGWRRLPFIGVSE